MLCPNPYEIHDIDRRTKEPKRQEATHTRPSEFHMRGSTTAQHLCEQCATEYDKDIAKRQDSNKKKRLEDVLKGNIAKYKRPVATTTAKED